MGEQFELPLGVIRDGEVHKDVVLTPMTAKIRRLLTTKESQKNPSVGISKLILSCCESIGGLTPSIQLISGLTTGDRDFILLRLRMISLGDDVTAQMTCPRCSDELTFDFNLPKIEIMRLTKDKDFEIEDNVPIVTLTNDDLGLVVRMRLPTGYDQEAISKQVTKDPVGAGYRLYTRLIQTWTKSGQDEINPNSIDFIDNLPLPEIDWLEMASRKAMPGPNWLVHMTCDVCSKSTLLDLSDSDFLFKTPR